MMNIRTLFCVAAMAFVSDTVTSAWAQSASGSVEQLPIERFDEYIPGQIPPPWHLMGSRDDQVTITLDRSGESPFIGNVDNGKGIVVRDQSSKSGHGAGVEIAFQTPPAGQAYLGFDFKLEPVSDKNHLDLVCDLIDNTGLGLRINLGGPDGTALLIKNTGTATDGSANDQKIDGLASGAWYHVAIDLNADGSATLNLLQKNTKKSEIKRVELAATDKKIRPQFQHLKFYNTASDAAVGSWSLDNICMTGEVSAPRDALLPHTRLPLSQLRASPRKVFAYYYEIYPAEYSTNDPGLGPYTTSVFNPTMTKKRPWLKDRIAAGTELLYHPLPRPRMLADVDASEMLVRSMEDEVRVAQQVGLDGFLLDFFAYPLPNNGSETFNKRSFALMEAARRLDPDFKIIPAVYAGKDEEGSTLEQQAERHAQSPTLLAALKHPQVLKLADGRAAFSMWGTERKSPEWWGMVVKKLEEQGIHAAFIGQFNGMSREKLQPYADVCAGMADWGPRAPIPYHWVQRVRDMTPLVISPVAMQDVRTRGREYWESRNSDTLLSTWKAAINDKSDWVFLTTWSDYTEQAMAPSTAIGFMPHDINTYYTQWFKTGEQPAITRDVLYYTYRRHHSDAQPTIGSPWKIRNVAGMETCNDIELLAFLKEPGKLRISIDGQNIDMDAPSGITSFKVPMPKDRTFVPAFSLSRAGKDIVVGEGRYAVLGQIEYANFLYHAGVIAAK